MNNVIQYASALKAFGCRLNLISDIAEVAVTDIPERTNSKEILDSFLTDIFKYSDTANYVDGFAATYLADTIDSNPNPIVEEIRENVLQALGLKQSGRFVAQELALIKVNRSWHISDEPNTCTRFGELCTNRGILDIEGKRGRKSTRQPNEYHRSNSKGISREQLVTPAVQALYDNIPSENLISVKTSLTSFSLRDISDLGKEELETLLTKVHEALSR